MSWFRDDETGVKNPAPNGQPAGSPAFPAAYAGELGEAARAPSIAPAWGPSAQSGPPAWNTSGDFEPGSSAPPPSSGPQERTMMRPFPRPPIAPPPSGPLYAPTGNTAQVPAGAGPGRAVWFALAAALVVVAASIVGLTFTLGRASGRQASGAGAPVPAAPSPSGTVTPIRAPDPTASSLAPTAGAVGVVVTAAATVPHAAPYCVVDVESWDVLYVRREPSAKAAAVGTIPPTACGVTRQGPATQVGSSTWWQVEFVAGDGTDIQGWSNSTYLRSA